MKPTYPDLSVPTVTSLRRSRRRLDRRRQDAERVTTAMQRGAALHLQFQNGRALWRLSGGAFVPTEVAAFVTSDPDVAVGEALFQDTPAQTWRFVQPKEDPR